MATSEEQGHLCPAILSARAVGEIPKAFVVTKPGRSLSADDVQVPTIFAGDHEGVKTDSK